MQTDDIAALVPHQGAMCLLERIVDWSHERIELASNTHRSAQNPLRRDGRLRSIHLCEYGAQTMAVHGALLSRDAQRKPQEGMLVSLRAVRFSRDYIEDLPGELRIEAQRLQASASSLQYSFRVLHEGEVLAEGRAAVMLGERSG